MKGCQNLVNKPMGHSTKRDSPSPQRNWNIIKISLLTTSHRKLNLSLFHSVIFIYHTLIFVIVQSWKNPKAKWTSNISNKKRPFSLFNAENSKSRFIRKNKSMRKQTLPKISDRPKRNLQFKRHRAWSRSIAKRVEKLWERRSESILRKKRIQKLVNKLERWSLTFRRNQNPSKISWMDFLEKSPPNTSI